MSPKILLIEDDALILEMYSKKLEKEGFQVEIVKNAKEALKKLEEEKFDLILLDRALPDMDGLEILKKIKANPQLKNKTEVIILTNISEKNDAENALNLGAKDYLVKAYYTPTEIVEKIKAILKPII